MKSSLEFESIKNIPGVQPEHPYEYFQEMNSQDWKLYQENAGMFTFYFGTQNLIFQDRINYFRQRCHDIQMYPDKGDVHFMGDLERDRKVASATRKDQIEFALMRQEHSDTHKDASWRSFSDYLSSTANECLSEAKKSGIMTDHQAKMIAFYLTQGRNSDLRSLSHSSLEKSPVFYGGFRLTISDIERLYPRVIGEAA